MMIQHMIVVGILALGGVSFSDTSEFLPLDGRWEYPHYLTYRPGNGQVCNVNPPRFSWPYVPEVIVGDGAVSVQEFCLQLSYTGDFSKPDTEVRTLYNFYNALPVLKARRCHWRVGYEVGTPRERWSPVRTFSIAQDAVRWDRTVINSAVTRLAERPHPRMGPSNRNWGQWRKKLQDDERTNRWLDEVLRRAESATRRPWWRQFPETDRKGKTQYDDQEFARMAGEIALVSFAYRFTGDERFEPAKENALALASFPKGGMSSPEYHGPPRKWPTQITEYLALCYDWWYEDLAADERKLLLGSIDWRLRATYLEKASWCSGNNICRQGVSVFCQSHPYENFMWSLPGVLLTAGDLPVADELTQLCLNYLTGVTSAHGPDEGWNEGVGYGGWKGQTMLHASLYTALLLPELHIERNPYYERLGQWYAHLMPLGIQRLSFGDYSATPQRHWGTQRENAKILGWLTGYGRFSQRAEALAQDIGDSAGDRPWLDLFTASSFSTPKPIVDSETSAFFPEAGWVMTSTQPHSQREAFTKAVGMIFQCRPRGGFSHSYRAENDFVWHAYGQTLSAGGGSTAYPDPHSRHSISHNVVLINGQGQQWDPRRPAYPFVGRIIGYREAKDYIYWVGDATHAYQTIPGLLRWYRHVVFVKGKWFALFDDLAMKPEAEPARFSWLFHVAPDVPFKILDSDASFSYVLGDVNAQVNLGNNPGTIQIMDMTGRNGFKNPITGEDLYAETAQKLSSKSRELNADQYMAHNVWVTNREPAREFQYLTSLIAYQKDQGRPDVSFEGGRRVKVSWADGSSESVSFDSNVTADVVIDVEAMRAHALSTEPKQLPPAGPLETINVGGDTYRVQWLAREDFQTNAWLSRWHVEGNSEVQVRDGKLWVRNINDEKPNVATIWFRPELPADTIIRFRAEAVPPAEKNAANLNLFLHARELDGSPLRFGRTGQYKEYHEIPNYIVTFVGGYRPGWSRVRRDPGFNMLHEADIKSEVGTQYSVVVTINKGRLRYYLDGRLIHEVLDTEPLPAGKFAIRTWSTNAWWDDVEFGKLLD